MQDELPPLNGIAAIQKRPGMYIGPIEPGGRAWLAAFGNGLQFLHNLISDEYRSIGGIYDLYRSVGTVYLDVEYDGQRLHCKFSWNNKSGTVSYFLASDTEKQALTLPILQSGFQELHSGNFQSNLSSDMVYLTALSTELKVEIQKENHSFTLGYTDGMLTKAEQKPCNLDEKYIEMTVIPASLFDRNMPDEARMLGYLARFEDQYLGIRIRFNKSDL